MLTLMDKVPEDKHRALVAALAHLLQLRNPSLGRQGALQRAAQAYHAYLAETAGGGPRQQTIRFEEWLCKLAHALSAVSLCHLHPCEVHAGFNTNTTQRPSFPPCYDADAASLMLNTALTILTVLQQVPLDEKEEYGEFAYAWHQVLLPPPDVDRVLASINPGGLPWRATRAPGQQLPTSSQVL
jgi:hypothetical protein